MADETQVCKECLKEKILLKFYARGNGYQPRCKTCFKKRYQGKKYRIKQHAGHLKRTFGITLDKYTELFDLQNGQCAICSTISPGKGRKNFCVDHNHLTGKIRGLLCYSCNIGISLLQEQLNVLKSAVRYLENE